MGTNVAMLNRSYFHFDAREAADRLCGSKAKDRKSLPIPLRDLLAHAVFSTAA
jgi:hypothetical protein